MPGRRWSAWRRWPVPQRDPEARVQLARAAGWKAVLVPGGRGVVGRDAWSGERMALSLLLVQNMIEVVSTNNIRIDVIRAKDR